MKRSPELRGERKTVGTVDNRCQFCDLLSNSNLTPWIVLIKLNNLLSVPDSGSVKTLVFSCFAGLLKEAHEQTITEVQVQISKSIIGSSKCFTLRENTVAYHLNWDCIVGIFTFTSVIGNCRGQNINIVLKVWWRSYLFIHYKERCNRRNNSEIKIFYAFIISCCKYINAGIY